MSIPASHSPSPSSAPVSRAGIPPYVAPAATAASVESGRSVGPFVPEPWRMALAAPGASTMAAESAANAPTPAAIVPLEVPTRIPPYRPLRPTPIVTPAMRTPLYIPTVPTPTAEVALPDEGVIAPQLLTTAEFAVPATALEKSDSLDSPAVIANALPVDESTLPWIDAYLSTTPALPTAAVPTPLENVVIEEAVAEDFELPVADTDGVAEGNANVAADAEAETVAESGADAVADAWPLADAVAEFRTLSAQLDSAMHGVSAPEELFANDAAPEPLPAWSDDDMMDIMPIRHSGKTPLSSPTLVSDGELWSDRARKAQEEAQVFRAMASSDVDAPAPADAAFEAPQDSAEVAAQALEVLARRVRAGELTLPGYDPRMGESAALVAALAAILGVRFR